MSHHDGIIKRTEHASSSTFILPADHPMMGPSNIPRPKRLSTRAPFLAATRHSKQKQRDDQAEPPRASRVESSSTSTSTSTSSTTALVLAATQTTTHYRLSISLRMIRNRQLSAGLRDHVDENRPRPTPEERQALLERLRTERLNRKNGLPIGTTGHAQTTGEVGTRTSRPAITHVEHKELVRTPIAKPASGKTGQHLEEKENTESAGEKQSLASASKKGKGKMTIEEMNKYNKEQQLLYSPRQEGLRVTKRTTRNETIVSQRETQLSQPRRQEDRPILNTMTTTNETNVLNGENQLLQPQQRENTRVATDDMIDDDCKRQRLQPQHLENRDASYDLRSSGLLTHLDDPLTTPGSPLSERDIRPSGFLGPTNDLVTTGASLTDLPLEDPLTMNDPESAPEEVSHSFSNCTTSETPIGPSNYFVSPSKLPVDEPSFADIASSTFMYEDRLSSTGEQILRPPLVLGPQQSTSQWGYPVYPKRMRKRTPPDTILNTPPGRILLPGQPNDLYDPERAAEHNELYKPRNFNDETRSHRPMLAEDASITLSYEWESTDNEDKHTRDQPTDKTRRFVMHTEPNRNAREAHFEAALARMVAKGSLESEGWNLPWKLEDGDSFPRKKAASQVPTGLPLEVPKGEGEATPYRAGAVTGPSWSWPTELQEQGQAEAMNCTGMSESVIAKRNPSLSPGKAHAQYEQTGWTTPEASLDTAVVSTGSQAGSRSPARSPGRSRSEPGIHVSKIPALLNHEDDLPDMMEQEEEGLASSSSRPRSVWDDPLPLRNTPAYYRALRERLAAKPYTGWPRTPSRSAWVDSLSDELEDGMEEHSAQTGENEASGEKSAEHSGSEDFERPRDPAGQGEGQENEDDESSAPPSPEYRDLPRRVNGVAQRLLSDSFLRAEAAKRRGGSNDGSIDRSRSPLEAPISMVNAAGRANSVTPEPETIPGRGSWRDGRSRHGFPPPERRNETSQEERAGSVVAESGTGAIQDGDGVEGFRTPPRQVVRREEEVMSSVSSPEATKNTTIPLIDPRREGGQRSPDSPAMPFDPAYDLPRRGKLADISMSGTPISRSASSRRSVGQASDSLNIDELLERMRAKIDGSTSQRGGVDNSRHDRALHRSLTILQQLKTSTAERNAAHSLIDERCSLMTSGSALSGGRISADRKQQEDVVGEEWEDVEEAAEGDAVVDQVQPNASAASLRRSSVGSEVDPFPEVNDWSRSLVYDASIDGWVLGPRKLWREDRVDAFGLRPIVHGSDPNRFPDLAASSSDLAREIARVFGGDTTEESENVGTREDSTQGPSVQEVVPSGTVSEEKAVSVPETEEEGARSILSIPPTSGRTSRRARQVHSSPKTNMSGRRISVTRAMSEGMPTTEDFEAGLFESVSGSEADTEDLGQGELGPEESSDEGESEAPIGHLRREEEKATVALPSPAASMVSPTASWSDSQSQAYSGHIPHGTPLVSIFEQTEPSESEEEDKRIDQGSTTPTVTPVGNVLQRIDERRELLFGAADLREAATQPLMMVPSGSYSFENGSPMPGRVRELSMLKRSMGIRDAGDASRMQEASPRAIQMTYPMDTRSRGEAATAGENTVLSPSTYITPWSERRGGPYPRFEAALLSSRAGTVPAGGIEGGHASVLLVPQADSAKASPEPAIELGVVAPGSVGREKRGELAPVWPAESGTGEESLLVDGSVEAENKIAYSRVYIDKLREEFRLAEERLDRARKNFLTGVKEFEQYQDGEGVAGTVMEVPHSSPWPKWYRWAWLFAIVIATCIFVMWNGQEVDYMDPFYTSRPADWQIWIMKLFGGAASTCRSGISPACWIWNPTPQDMLLYSRRYAYTPI